MAQPTPALRRSKMLEILEAGGTAQAAEAMVTRPAGKAHAAPASARIWASSDFQAADTDKTGRIMADAAGRRPSGELDGREIEVSSPSEEGLPPMEG